MTKQALYLLWISSGLFSSFFIAIVSTWFFGYFSEISNRKAKEKVEEMVSSFFTVGNDEKVKQDIVQNLQAFIGQRVSRKDLLINTIISYGEEFIENNHDLLMNFYEITGIKAFLIQRLSSNSVHVKSLACRQLGELQLKSTEEHIVKLISSKNNDVIYNVLLTLAKLGDIKGLALILTKDSGNINISSRAIIEIISASKGNKEDLFKATIESSDVYIKGILIKAAADYQIEGLRDTYIKYLNCDNKNLRIACIRALCELENPANEQSVIDMLDDKDWEVRAAAAKSLEKLGTSNSFEALGKTTSDSEWWVRHNAASTLVFIPGGKEYANKIIAGDDKYAREAVVSVIEITS